MTNLDPDTVHVAECIVRMIRLEHQIAADFRAAWRGNRAGATVVVRYGMEPHHETLAAITSYPNAVGEPIDGLWVYSIGSDDDDFAFVNIRTGERVVFPMSDAFMAMTDDGDPGDVDDPPCGGPYDAPAKHGL